MRYALLFIFILWSGIAIAATCEEGQTKPGPTPCLQLICIEGYWASEAANDGGGCNDGNPCTAGDVCRSGECRGGPLRGFDDRNPCTVDTCDPVGGIKHTPVEKDLGPCNVGAGKCRVDGSSKCVNGKSVCTPLVEVKKNACGGCGELAFKPDEPCGKCGKYACKGLENVVCSDPGANVCGNCGPPADEDNDGVPDCIAECRTGTKETCEIEGLKGICAVGEKICQKGKWGGCVGVNKPTKEVCDNKFDDDCDGLLDLEDIRDCECVNDMVRRCYSGPPHTRGVGECKDGYETCQDNHWGKCSGDVLPAAESCNNLDDDCNGVVDDGIDC